MHTQTNFPKVDYVYDKQLFNLSGVKGLNWHGY
jgi:hypothetical protein